LALIPDLLLSAKHLFFAAKAHIRRDAANDEPTREAAMAAFAKS